MGSTNNIERRVEEHNQGSVSSTKFLKPFKVVFQEKFSSEVEARYFERRLKDKRIEKEAIIRGIKSS